MEEEEVEEVEVVVVVVYSHHHHVHARLPFQMSGLSVSKWALSTCLSEILMEWVFTHLVCFADCLIRNYSLREHSLLRTSWEAIVQ